VKRLALAATPIFSTVEPEPRHGSTLASLKPAPPTVIHLRDGEVVLYRRAGSPYWQVRYKLRTGAWVRESTAQAAMENAIPTARDQHDEHGFAQRIERNGPGRRARPSGDDVRPICDPALPRLGLTQSQYRQAISHPMILPPVGGLGLRLEAESRC